MFTLQTFTISHHKAFAFSHISQSSHIFPKHLFFAYFHKPFIFHMFLHWITFTFHILFHIAKYLLFAYFYALQNIYFSHIFFHIVNYLLFACFSTSQNIYFLHLFHTTKHLFFAYFFSLQSDMYEKKTHLLLTLTWC